MAKTILMRTPQQEKEARLVAGMYDKNRKKQSELYAYCSRYFWANYRGVFFADGETASDIFQNSFLAMWENIELHIPEHIRSLLQVLQLSLYWI